MLFFGKPVPIQITFSVEPGKEGDRMARFKFWDSPSTAQWFKGHGYTLYQRVKDSAVLRPAILSEAKYNEAEYPHAYYDSETSNPNSQPLQVYERWVSFDDVIPSYITHLKCIFNRAK